MCSGSLVVDSLLIVAPIHASEPQYSKGAVIVWWLQSTSAQNSVPSNILVNILLLKILIARTIVAYKSSYVSA